MAVSWSWTLQTTWGLTSSRKKIMLLVRGPRVQDQQNVMVWEVVKHPVFSPDLLPRVFRMLGPLNKNPWIYNGWHHAGSRGIAVLVAAQGILCRWNTQLVDQCDFCPYAGGDVFPNCYTFTCEHTKTGFNCICLTDSTHVCNICREALNQP